MACEQVIVSEAIAKAVAEAMRAAIQAMVVSTTERPQAWWDPKYLDLP